MYICDSTPLYSSYNKRLFRRSFRRKSKHISCSVSFFSKVVPFMRQCQKYSTAGQTTDSNTTRRMRIAYWIHRVANTHSEYVIYYYLYHGNNGYANAPYCDVYTCIDCLFNNFTQCQGRLVSKTNSYMEILGTKSLSEKAAIVADNYRGFYQSL
jgi:hypothetical protein